MALDRDDAPYDGLTTDPTPYMDDDFTRAMAAGEIHNKVVAELLEGVPPGGGIKELALATLRTGCARGMISARAEKELRRTFDVIDPDAKDLGLAEVERMRKTSVREDAEFVVITIQQIAAASIRNGLDELAQPGGDTKAKRRRIWKIVFSDLAGGGAGFLLGGIGGAIAGAVAGSAGAAAADE